MAKFMQPAGARGRGARTTTPGARVTKSAMQVEKKTGSSRPIGRGGGKNRGNRVDTNPRYTGSRKRTPNMVDPRGTGKKQIQAGGKARKGGGKKQKGTYDQPLMQR